MDVGLSAKMEMSASGARHLGQAAVCPADGASSVVASTVLALMSGCGVRQCSIRRKIRMMLLVSIRSGGRLLSSLVRKMVPSGSRRWKVPEPLRAFGTCVELEETGCELSRRIVGVNYLSSGKRSCKGFDYGDSRSCNLSVTVERLITDRTKVARLRKSRSHRSNYHPGTSVASNLIVEVTMESVEGSGDCPSLASSGGTDDR